MSERALNDPQLSLLYHRPCSTTNDPFQTASYPTSSPILPSLFPSTLSRRVSSSSISPGVPPPTRSALSTPTPAQSLYSLSHPHLQRRLSSTPLPSARMSDLIHSTPPSVTRFLILSAPLVRATRAGLQVLLWREHDGRPKAIGVLAAWWAVCLLGWPILRWALPPLLFFLYFYPTLPTISDFLTSIFSPHVLSSKPSPSLPAAIISSSHPIRPLRPTPLQSEPATSQTLAQTISDYSALHSIFAQAWPGWLGDLKSVQEGVGKKRLLRALAGTWLVWVLGGWIFGVRIMVGTIGTVILLLPSPYLPPLISALQSSRTVNHLFSVLALAILGPSDERTAPPNLDHPRPSLLPSLFTSNIFPSTRGRSGSIKSLLGLGGESSAEKGHEQELKMEWEEEPLMYRFELMENQRWWLALDWTSTLAPGDRPLWCDTYLHPTHPPAQFSLPSSSKIVVPSSTHPLTFEEERTTFWRWVDDDWAVLRNFHPDASVLSGSQGSGGGGGGGGGVGGFARGFTTFVPNKVSSSGSVGTLGTDPLPASSSSPAGAGSLSSPTTALGFQSRMSLGEAALSKGLERLKAATTHVSLPSSADPTSPTFASNRHLSSIMTTGSSSSHGTEAEGQPTLWSGAGMSAGSGGVGNVQGSAGNIGGGGLDKEVEDLDALTDEMGWSYGGNKWENLNSKGGLGKFTRRRRWVRKAVLIESIRLLPITLQSPPPLPNPSVLLSDRTLPDAPGQSSRPLTRASSISRSASGLHPPRGGSVGGVETISAESSSAGGYGASGASKETATTEILRQRLRAAGGSAEGSFDST